MGKLAETMKRPGTDWTVRRCQSLIRTGAQCKQEAVGKTKKCTMHKVMKSTESKSSSVDRQYTDKEWRIAIAPLYQIQRDRLTEK